MSELPQGWVETTLDQIASRDRPRELPRDNPELPFIGMENVESQSMRLLGTVPAGQLKSSAVHFQPGDVLYGRLRPYLNKVLVARVEGLCSAEFIVFSERPEINSSWLGYLLNSSEFVRFSSHLNTGDRPRVDFDQIGEYQLGLAPRPEQDRIVDEIEKQFTRLDAATAALKRVQANLKRYRASVLNAACEGRLVPTRPASVGYRRAEVRDLLRESLANGRSPQTTETGCKILRLTAIKDGQVDTDEWRMGAVTDAWIANLGIVSGDILISRGNGSKSLVGLAGLVNARAPESEPILFPDTMIRARLDPALCDARYFVLIWNSRFVREQIERTARTTAGIHKISQADIERFEIPLPSLDDQIAIVTMAEQAFAILQRIVETVTKMMLRAAQLRASILASAFSGYLVPQDPNDEPAFSLLDRIRAERTPKSKPPARPKREELVHA